MVSGLSLVPGGGIAPGHQAVGDPARAGEKQPPGQARGERWRLPGTDAPGTDQGGAAAPTLAELFSASPRDGGWAGFLLGQVDPTRPLLWVQERMAILECGRVYPPGMQFHDLIHVEARDARAALWAMEEGLRCAAIGAVIGEIWGDPGSLDFTATRRLAVAAERHGVAAFLVRLGGTANLSGARLRWRVASGPSLPNRLNRQAPGAAAWEVELFRARGHAPGKWVVTHEPGEGKGGTAGGFHLVAEPCDRALGETHFKQTG